MIICPSIGRPINELGDPNFGQPNEHFGRRIDWLIDEQKILYRELNVNTHLQNLTACLKMLMTEELGDEEWRGELRLRLVPWDSIILPDLLYLRWHIWNDGSVWILQHKRMMTFQIFWSGAAGDIKNTKEDGELLLLQTT